MLALCPFSCSSQDSSFNNAYASDKCSFSLADYRCFFDRVHCPIQPPVASWSQVLNITAWIQSLIASPRYSPIVPQSFPDLKMCKFKYVQFTCECVACEVFEKEDCFDDQVAQEFHAAATSTTFYRPGFCTRTPQSSNGPIEQYDQICQNCEAEQDHKHRLEMRRLTIVTLNDVRKWVDSIPDLRLKFGKRFFKARWQIRYLESSYDRQKERELSRYFIDFDGPIQDTNQQELTHAGNAMKAAVDLLDSADCTARDSNQAAGLIDIAIMHYQRVVAMYEDYIMYLETFRCTSYIFPFLSPTLRTQLQAWLLTLPETQKQIDAGRDIRDIAESMSADTEDEGEPFESDEDIDNDDDADSDDDYDDDEDDED